MDYNGHFVGQENTKILTLFCSDCRRGANFRDFNNVFNCCVVKKEEREKKKRLSGEMCSPRKIFFLICHGYFDFLEIMFLE